MSDTETSNSSKDLSHTTLVKFVRAFAPDLTEAGVCSGFCALWIQAVLTGQLQEAEFYTRLDWLAEHFEGKQNNKWRFKQLEKEIENTFNQGSSSESTLKTEKEFLIQLRAFSEATALCQAMVHLEIPGETPSVNNLPNAYSLVASDILQEKNQQLLVTPLGVTVASEQEVTDYFGSVQKILQEKISAKLSNSRNAQNVFLLSSEDHSVAVYFHILSHKWRFLDINTLRKQEKENYYYEVNTPELASLIFKAFRDEEAPYTAFSVRHISSISTRQKNTESEALLKILGEIILPLNPQKTNSRGINALYLACKIDSPDIIKKLNAQQVELNAFFDEKNEEFPLLLAVTYGNIDSVKTLIEAGADINQINSNGQTALMVTSRFDYTSITDYLLSSTPKPNVHYINHLTGDTALTIAAEKGHTEIVKSLMAARTEDLSGEASMAFLLAGSNGHTEVVSALLAEPRLQLNKNLLYRDGDTALIMAAQNGHHATCTALVAAGVDPSIINQEGESALSALAKMGLTEYELCPLSELPKNTPLSYGKIYYETLGQQLKYLMRDTHDIEVKGVISLSKKPTYVEMLHKISKNGHADGKIAAFLDLLNISMRKKPSNPNHPDAAIIKFAPFLYSQVGLEALSKNGYTPLLQAVKENLTSVVQLLLSLYANPNVCTPAGETALILALKNPHQNPDMIQTILMDTSLIDAVDAQGNSALTLAIKNKAWDIVESLILRGADTTNALALVIDDAPQPIIDLLHKKADDATLEKLIPPLSIILSAPFASPSSAPTSPSSENTTEPPSPDAVFPAKKQP